MDINLQTLCITNKLYSIIKIIDNSDKISCARALCSTGTLRAYCVECGNDSIFEFNNVETPQRKTVQNNNFLPMPSEDTLLLGTFNSISKVKYISLIGKCAVNKDHTIIFHFYVTYNSVIKIGQYPSYADLMQPTTKKYRNVLNADKFKEFNRAIGLASSDIGIGSFVYLRRIFEDILETAHKKAEKVTGWNETEYQGKKVHEKIACLKGFLPQFLVENWTLYAILSKGIHELSEEECIKYFPVVKSGIELILDELLAKKEQEQKIVEAQKAIGQLHSQIKSNQ